MVFLPQATYGQMGTVAQPMQAPAQDVADPFVWGSGGRRMSPEDIAAEREIAATLMQNGMDFSPVGHWTQGLARVGQSLVGALQSSHADKAAEANKAYEDQIAQALLGGGDQASIAGRVLTDPNLANLQPVAKMIYERANPKPINNDTKNDLDLIEARLGTDAGTNYLRGVADPIVTIPLPGGGVISAPRSEVPALMAQLSGGVAPTGGAAPVKPVGKLTPIPDEGGPTARPSGGF